MGYEPLKDGERVRTRVACVDQHLIGNQPFNQ